MIAEEEVARLLEQIDSGDVTLNAKHLPADVFAGNVEYEASNGWKLVVFNDCNDWDYLDSVTAPDGRSIDYEELDQMPAVISYNPYETARVKPVWLWGKKA